jgi:predicted  nucleic acid-binding Zn-ribbon protein
MKEQLQKFHSELVEELQNDAGKYLALKQDINRLVGERDTLNSLIATKERELLGLEGYIKSSEDYIYKMEAKINGLESDQSEIAVV